jgi:hypothetical protein
MPEGETSINMRIHMIAVKGCDLGLKDQIHREIQKALGVTEKKVTRILNNTTTLTRAEAHVIAQILSKYMHTTQEDIFEPCKRGAA